MENSHNFYVTSMVCYVDTLVLSPLCGLAVVETNTEKESVVLNSEPF